MAWFDNVTKWLGNQWNNITGATAKMEWEKQMSDTAHQREVADMKAAGLNPVLSAGGSGASTPSAPSGGGDPISAILGLVSTATGVMHASASLIKANAAKSFANTGAGYMQHKANQYSQYLNYMSHRLTGKGYKSIN